MKKRGLFGILGTVFLALVIATVLLVVYFYYFHVFETARVCVSGESQSTNITCQIDDDCRGVTNLFIGNINFNSAPTILSESVNRVINESIYCDGVCFVRETRSVNSTSDKFEFLDSCFENETEIVADIRAKDAVQLFRWIRGK